MTTTTTTTTTVDTTADTAVDTTTTTVDTTTTTVDTLAKERAELVARRNALMSKSTANQTDSFKEMLVCFRGVFPTVAEATEIVVANGGLKQSSETKNTATLLYIVQLGSDTFNALFDAFQPSNEQRKSLSAKDMDIKAAEYALSVYRAMIVLDKHASLVKETTKFTLKTKA